MIKRKKMDRSEKYLKEVVNLGCQWLIRQDAWRDIKRDEFMTRHISPLIQQSTDYGKVLDERSEQLEDTRRKIAELVGDDEAVSSTFVGYQNERGDLAGGKNSFPFMFFVEQNTR